MNCELKELSIPQLVGEVYEAAPPAERGQLLRTLLRPLSLLSTCAIAGGVFAQMRLRSGWHEMNLRLEDLQSVDMGQVAQLADHAQQVSVETVDGLAQLLLSSPSLSGSAVAALLVAVLVQRARARHRPAHHPPTAA